MQILDIVLYGDGDRVRRLPLRIGELNIITGDSGTGKSALIQIVEYALGRDEFLIPEGVISRSVRWYALRLQFLDTQVFVARRAPDDWKASTGETFMQVGADLPIPSQTSLVPNTTPKDLNEYLTRLLRVAPNLNVPDEGGTRLPLQATLRHGLIYSFQAQTEIAKNNLLFHRQDDAFMPQAIKDTLPYFLGAVDEERVAKMQELRRLKRELGQAQRRTQEITTVVGTGLEKGIALLAEAQAVGIAQASSDTPDNAAELTRLLAAALTWTPQEPPRTPEDVLARLQDEHARLLDEYRFHGDRIRAAKNCEEGQKGYAYEAQEQRARLAYVGLYREASDVTYITCPLCESELKEVPPSVTNVVQSLGRITAQLTAVATEQPRLREFIDAQEEKVVDLRRRLSEVKGQMKALTEQQPEVQELMAINSRAARVVGRISLYMESLAEIADARNAAPGRAQQNDDVEPLQARVAELEEELADTAPEDLLPSILNIVNQQIGVFARALNLEFSDFPLRLDLKRLAIIADIPDRGPVPLVRIGSGANWVGYHLATYLALHHWFIQRRRPVPRFLFLDQPTQVYYPQERDAAGSLDVLNPGDRAIVRHMFEWLFETVQNLTPNLQVIVIDHADLVDDWFERQVVERWRHGQKLIPLEWISETVK